MVYGARGTSRVFGLGAVFVMGACSAGVASGPKASTLDATDVYASADVTPSVDIGSGDDADAAVTETVGDAGSVGDSVAACTYSSDCPAAASVCLGGACVPQTACSSDKQCQASGQVCDTVSGMCVACIGDVDCTDGLSCKAHKCVAPPPPCKTSKECAVGLVCDKGLGACVECASSDDCVVGMACVETMCVPMACKPGAAKCASTSSLTKCAPNGTNWVVTPCEGGTTCLADTCTSLLCAPKSKVCDGKLTVAQCDDSGMALAPLATCDGTTTVCLAGECVPTVCKPAEKMCVNQTTVGECKADGTGFTSSPCGADSACKAGACVAVLCQPNTSFCQGKVVATCNADGTAFATGADCSATGQVCSGGSCQTITCVPGAMTCAGTTLSTCNADGTDYTAASCDDGNSCTFDTCDSTKGCIHTPTFGTCDDQQACTTGDTCDSTGKCIGTVVACGAGANCLEPGGCQCLAGFVGDGFSCACGPALLQVDIDGVPACAANYPAWGVRPESPPAAWFVDNGDGTITDTQTALTWQLKATGYVNCEKLTLGGKSDWRLPTIFELATLQDLTVGAPQIAQVLAATTTQANYRTQSPRMTKGYDGYTWMVSFKNGGWGGVSPTSTSPLSRCVRTASPATPAPVNRYQVNASAGTVKDIVTGLTWQRLATYQGAWLDAIAYCDGLALDGGGWRLPNVLELRSLLDVNTEDQLADATAFPAALPEAFWSITKSKLTLTETFFVNFGQGVEVIPNPTYAATVVLRVRCVR